MHVHWHMYGCCHSARQLRRWKAKAACTLHMHPTQAPSRPHPGLPRAQAPLEVEAGAAGIRVLRPAARRQRRARVWERPRQHEHARAGRQALPPPPGRQARGPRPLPRRVRPAAAQVPTSNAVPAQLGNFTLSVLHAAEVQRIVPRQGHFTTCGMSKYAAQGRTWHPQVRAFLRYGQRSELQQSRLCRWPAATGRCGGTHHQLRHSSQCLCTAADGQRRSAWGAGSGPVVPQYLRAVTCPQATNTHYPCFSLLRPHSRGTVYIKRAVPAQLRWLRRLRARLLFGLAEACATAQSDQQRGWQPGWEPGLAAWQPAPPP